MSDDRSLLGRPAGAVLISLEFVREGEGVEDDEEQATFNLLQNVTIAAIVGAQNEDGSADGLLTTILPQ